MIKKQIQKIHLQKKFFEFGLTRKEGEEEEDSHAKRMRKRQD